MVKHRQFDATVTSSRLSLAESDVKQEFHCFRCNILKRHRVRAFWETPEGEKTVCKGCYDDLLKKKGKQHKKDDKKRQREDAAEKEAKRQKENDYVLCPLLLDELEKSNNHIGLDQFLQLVIKHINEENSGHYYTKFVPLLVEHGWSATSDSNDNSIVFSSDIPLENGKVASSGEKLEQLSRLLVTIHKKESCFKEHQRKIIQKIKAKVDFAVEKEQNLDVWLTLTSANDLRKMRACLEDTKHLERVSKTILDFVIPEIQQMRSQKSSKEDLQTVKTELWNTASLIKNILKSNSNTLSEAGTQQGKKVLSEIVSSMIGFFSDKQLKSLQQDTALNNQ